MGKAGSNPAFSVLVAVVNATGLGSALDSTTDKVTVFAPTDDAFAFFLEASNLTAEEALANTDLLTKILTYHVLPDVVGYEDMQSGTRGFGRGNLRVRRPPLRASDGGQNSGRGVRSNHRAGQRVGVQRRHPGDRCRPRARSLERAVRGQEEES